MKPEEIKQLSNDQKLWLIEALVLSPGWSILAEWLENEIKNEDVVINKVNPEHNKVLYTEKDVHILNKNNLQSIIDKPTEWMLTLKDATPKWPTLEEALNDINTMSITPPSTRLL